MEGQIPVYSEIVVNAANSLRSHFDACNMSVPPLHDLFLATVAMKVQPRGWQKLLGVVAPLAGNHLVDLTKNAVHMSHELTSNPLVAIHVLALAPVSENATACTNFMNFVQHLGYTTPTPALQMMFFSLGVLKESKSNIWDSHLMSETLGKSTPVIRSQILPKVEDFYEQINHAELPNDFATLLAGIKFDQTKLIKSVVQRADFPCQRPRIAKGYKQGHRADFVLKVNALNDLESKVDPNLITDEDRELMKKFRQLHAEINETTKHSMLEAEFVKARALEARWTKQVAIGTRLVEVLQQRCIEAIAPYQDVCRRVDRQFLQEFGQMHYVQMTVPNRETLRQMSTSELSKLHTDLVKNTKYLSSQPMVK